MTDQELQQLAREYAELHPPQTVDEGLRQYGMFLNATEVFEPFLSWLLRNHCIVSREKVKSLCRLTVENSISIDYGLIDGLTDLVCDMFNEEYHNEMDDYDRYLKGEDK